MLLRPSDIRRFAKVVSDHCVDRGIDERGSEIGEGGHDEAGLDERPDVEKVGDQYAVGR